MAAVGDYLERKPLPPSLLNSSFPESSAPGDAIHRSEPAVATSPSVNQLRSRIAATIEMEALHGSRITRRPRHSLSLEGGHVGPSIRRSQSSFSLKEAVPKQKARARADSHIEDAQDRRPRTPRARYSLYPSQDHWVPSTPYSNVFPSLDTLSPTIRSRSSAPAIKSPLSNVVLKPDEDSISSPQKSTHSASSSQRLSTSNSHPLQNHTKPPKSAKRFRISLPRILGKIPEPTVEMSFPSPPKDGDAAAPTTAATKESTSKIPAWRYEDYAEEPQMTIPYQKHKRSISSIFRHKRSTYRERSRSGLVAESPDGMMKEPRRSPLNATN